MAHLEQPVGAPAGAIAATPDERLKTVSLVTRLMRRPELGAAAGLILVTIFFLSTADSSMFTLAGIMNILTPSSQLGILAIAAALLMIGGEFDLSIGSMVAFSGLIFGGFLLLAGLPLLPAILATFVGGGGPRRHQRPDRHPHAAAVLHRHAGVPVHPARPFARRAEMGHRRLDADARHRRAGGRRHRARDVFRKRPRGSFRVACRARHHRQIPEWHAHRHGRPRFDHMVRPVHRSRHMVAAAHESRATGFSPPAATPMRRAIPAFRWIGSRRACSC